MTKLVIALFAVLACAAAPSFAADEAGTQGPCKADRAKFCGDVKPGQGRIMKCIKEHQADLSPECKAKVAAVKEKMKENKAAFEDSCGADVKSLCGDVKAGHGAVMKCLRENKEKASETCKKFMAAKKEERMERREKRKAMRGAAQGGGAKPAGASGEGE